MDENDDEEEEEEEEKTGWVRRDFKFGASNNIVSVPIKKNPNFFFFFFFISRRSSKIFPFSCTSKKEFLERERKKREKN